MANFIHSIQWSYFFLDRVVFVSQNQCHLCLTSATYACPLQRRACPYLEIAPNILGYLTAAANTYFSKDVSHVSSFHLKHFYKITINYSHSRLHMNVLLYCMRDDCVARFLVLQDLHENNQKEIRRQVLLHSFNLNVC